MACSLIIRLMGGISASHCRATIGEDFSAPVAMRSALLWICSSDSRFDLHVVISIGEDFTSDD